VANIFPRWTNYIPHAIGVGAPLALGGAVFTIWYWFSPYYTDVGYQPAQPVPYSHRLHVGELGLDCRYCHTTVEEAGFSAIPPAATCMNCHSQVKTDSPKLAPIRESYETGKPVEWVKVHQLPDYAYFNHSVHVKAGVGCESCHGRVDTMDVVYMAEPLSMGWCLDCHRNPAPHLRPLDKVTEMGWNDKQQELRDQGSAEAYDPSQDPDRTGMFVNPPEHCSGCHR